MSAKPGDSIHLLGIDRFPVPAWLIAGKKFVTITPNGPDDGGDFGPNTPGTTSGGVNEALAYAQANGIDIILTPDRVIFVGQGTNKNLEINLNGQGVSLIPEDANLDVDSVGNLHLNSGANGNSLLLSYDISQPVFFATKVNGFNRINTVGYGLSPVYGLDNRKGITAADASAITLYTPNGTNQIYKVKARINATAVGTSGSATYTIKWTENGVVLSQSLTVSAANSPQSLDILIQPDSGTPITAQITALTSATVNVSAEVEEVA